MINLGDFPKTTMGHVKQYWLFRDKKTKKLLGENVSHDGKIIENAEILHTVDYNDCLEVESYLSDKITKLNQAILNLENVGRRIRHIIKKPTKVVKESDETVNMVRELVQQKQSLEHKNSIFADAFVRIKNNPENVENELKLLVKKLSVDKSFGYLEDGLSKRKETNMAAKTKKVAKKAVKKATSKKK